jgi:hypothetical protein
MGSVVRLFDLVNNQRFPPATQQKKKPQTDSFQVVSIVAFSLLVSKFFKLFS